LNIPSHHVSPRIALDRGLVDQFAHDAVNAQSDWGRLAQSDLPVDGLSPGGLVGIDLPGGCGSSGRRSGCHRRCVRRRRRKGRRR
jgi:hypothetical protein